MTVRIHHLIPLFCGACLLSGCLYLEEAQQPDPSMQRAYRAERQVAELRKENARYAREMAALRSDMRLLQESQGKLLGQVGELQMHARDRAAQVQELRSLVAAMEQRLQTTDAGWRNRMQRLQTDLAKDHERAMGQMAQSVAEEIATVRANQPPPGPAGGGTYEVQAGDTLSAIAQAFGTTIAEIKRANGLSNDLIRVGQTLKIPGH